jgi:AcrR family transcriptional regulator
MTARKPPRRTRERILAVSLALFNDFGEPNVTTTTLSAELNISPGNLYYHFRSKDAIVDELFEAFERELRTILAVPPDRPVTVEDLWLFLHLLFETIWKYRFLYRDLSDLLSRNRLLETHFKQILADKIATTRALCGSLAAGGGMRAEPAELEPLATNMMVVATYWLGFAFVRSPRRFVAGEVVAAGAYQVMALIAPYLVGDGRALFVRLAEEYRTARPA